MLDLNRIYPDCRDNSLKRWGVTFSKRICLVVALLFTVGAINQAVAEGALYKLDIPAQPLGDALQQLAERADIQIIYSRSLVADKAAPALAGNFALESALSSLLIGSGLSYSFSSKDSVVIKAAPVEPESSSGNKSSRTPDQKQTKGFVLEEVTVTARKREESLQDTPLSVTAISGTELALSQINSSQDLSNITPNLSFDSYASASGSNAAASVFIRGIGQTDFVPTTAPGVGIYIDGVYMAQSIGAAFDFIEVQRIEVLRGPQGTLFGKNTIGGAVVIHTKKPANEFGGRVEFELGSDNQTNGTFALDIPISDQLLTQVSGTVRNRDGYVKNIITGRDMGDDDSRGVRFAALFTPSDNLEFFFTADHTHERENGAPNVLVGINDRAPFVAIANAASAGCPVSFPPPQSSPLGNSACANSQWELAPHKVAANADLVSELDVYGTALHVDWDLDLLNIKSISSYRKVDSSSRRDGDNTPLTIAHTGDVLQQDQFSQELQFSGTLLDDRLNWMFGLYYFTEEAENPNIVDLSIGSILSGGEVESRTKAVFSQATYNLTERLSLTAGLRYTKEKQTFLPDQYALTPYLSPTGLLLPLDQGGSRILPHDTVTNEISETTPMATLSYYVTDELMTYVSYSEGFKNGGFHQRIPAPLPEVPTFGPEFADVWEVGFKYTKDWLRINGSIFNTDYTDIQTVVRRGFAPVTINAGDARINGFELEGSIVPTPNWYFMFGVGYLDAKYINIPTEVLNNNTINKSSELTNTPEWSTNFRAAYSKDVGELGSLTLRLDWIYRSSAFKTTNNASYLEQQSYNLLNAAIIFEDPSQDWRIMLAGKNLHDEIYLINGADSLGTAQGVADGAFSRGREWTLSISRNF